MFSPAANLVSQSLQRLRSVAHIRPCLLLLGLLCAQTAAAQTVAVQTAAAQETLSLRQAIDQALQSPAAEASRQQIGVAEGLRRQANLPINPRLYLESEDIRFGNNPNYTFANSTEDYAYISQTFEIDGKRAKRTAVATANLHRTQAENELRLREIAGGVAAAYWIAAADTKIVTLLQEDLTAVDEMVRYHKERVDAGAMRGVDLIRMKLERDRVYLFLQAAQRDAELARTELYKLIGKVSQQNIVFSDDVTTSPDLPEIDLATALAQRIDITVARDQVAAAEADVRLQHAIAVPDPDLFGGYKRNVGVNTAYAALQIPLPLRNRNQGEILRAEAQVRVAKANLAQTEINVRADIEAALENYHRELAIVRETLPEMRTLGRQNLDILSDAYRTGGVDLLRYIDAERTEFDVEVSAIRTLAEYHQSVLRLQLAYGGQL